MGLRRILCKLSQLRSQETGTSAIELGIVASLMAFAIVQFISDIDDPEGLLGRIAALVNGIFD